MKATNTPIALIMIFLLSACSYKSTFPVSPIVPAAEGYAKVKKNGSNSYEIEVSVKNLAEPDRLTPSKDVYIVWIETDKNVVENIGQIVVSSSFFSKVKKGSLEAVSSDKPEEVFITAEDHVNTPYPGPQIVLKTDID